MKTNNSEKSDANRASDIRQSAINTANEWADAFETLSDNVDQLTQKVNQLEQEKADNAYIEDNLLYLTAQGQPITDGIEIPCTCPCCENPPGETDIRVDRICTEGMNSITVRSEGAPEFTIHWGDDTTTDAAGSESDTYEHTYAAAGVYTITISNCSDVIAVDFGRLELEAFWSIGNSRLANLSFREYTNLKAVGSDLFKNDTSRTDFAAVFSKCNSLQEVPEDLFKHCTEAESFEEAFWHCTNLQLISDRLFATCTKVTNLWYAFGYTGLRSIPENLLSSMSELVTIRELFIGCSHLTCIPCGLFRNNTQITSIREVFRSCTRLVSIPGNLFSSLYGVTNAASCFAECSKLETIPGNLFSCNPELEFFYYTFNRCTSLKSIPGDLFKENTKANSFKDCFSECGELERLPENLFAGKTLVTSFESVFSHCTKLREIPSSLFSGCVSAQTFRSAFNSTAIEIIPDDLFVDCRATNDMELAFINCQSLKAVKKEIFRNIGADAITHNLFSECISLEYAEIPPNFTALGVRMFSGCTNLSYIETFTETPQLIVLDAFFNTNNCPIYVPDTAVDAYKQANGWTQYADRIFPKSQKPE